jgi:hypothetical protein
MQSDGVQIDHPSSGVRTFLTTFTLFDVGIGIYIVSFFLPAVNAAYMGDIVGWQCAWLAFFSLGEDKSLSPLAIFGALINPIAIAYIVLRIFDRAPKARVRLASAILLFIPITWLSLLMMHFSIRIGHVAWIVGLLLIISWKDYRDRRPGPN